MKEYRLHITLVLGFYGLLYVAFKFGIEYAEDRKTALIKAAYAEGFTAGKEEKETEINEALPDIGECIQQVYKRDHQIQGDK